MILFIAVGESPVNQSFELMNHHRELDDILTAACGDSGIEQRYAMMTPQGGLGVRTTVENQQNTASLVTASAPVVLLS